MSVTHMLFSRVSLAGLLAATLASGALAQTPAPAETPAAAAPAPAPAPAPAAPAAAAPSPAPAAPAAVAPSPAPAAPAAAAPAPAPAAPAAAAPAPAPAAPAAAAPAPAPAAPAAAAPSPAPAAPAAAAPAPAPQQSTEAPKAIQDLAVMYLVAATVQLCELDLSDDDDEKLQKVVDAAEEAAGLKAEVRDAMWNKVVADISRDTKKACSDYASEAMAVVRAMK